MGNAFRHVRGIDSHEVGNSGRNFHDAGVGTAFRLTQCFPFFAFEHGASETNEISTRLGFHDFNVRNGELSLKINANKAKVMESSGMFKGKLWVSGVNLEEVQLRLLGLGSDYVPISSQRLLVEKLLVTQILQHLQCF